VKCGFVAALSSKCQRSEGFPRGLHLLGLVDQRRQGRHYFLETRMGATARCADGRKQAWNSAALPVNFTLRLLMSAWISAEELDVNGWTGVE
jgi:hypothetical protein